MNAAGFSARAGLSARGISEKNSGFPGHTALAGMLRKAWTALTKG
jgi:hypothetical protein